MFHRVLSVYKPYMLGLRSLFQYAAGGMLPSSEDRKISKRLEASRLEQAVGRAPYGAPHMYKSLDAAVAVVAMARALDDRLGTAHELANNFYRALDELQLYFFLLNRSKEEAHCRFKGKQVVVLEGFDLSGKSTLKKGMVSRFRNTMSCSLDSVWPDLNDIFATLPEAVYGAFNCIRCYMLAQQIMEAEEHQTIFVERYFHYFCATAACLDRARDPRSLAEVAYYWPNDLPQPDLVLFLALTKEQLDERWAAAGHDILDEERLKYLELAYSFVNGPPIAAIDAGTSAESLLSLVEEIMVHHCNIELYARPPSISIDLSAEANSVGEGISERGEEEAGLRQHEQRPDEEEIVLDDVFDSEPTHGSSLRGQSSSFNKKKMNSRRSSLGVFGAFSELKMDW